MQVSTILLEATTKLNAANFGTAKLDAEVLLCFVLQKNRAWLLAHSGDDLHQTALGKYDKLIKRRLANEPVAYLTGYKEFYGRDFAVDKNVLVPRPESESFITLLKEMKHENIRAMKINDKQKDSDFKGFLHNILDIGTGSGCLAITTKLEFADTHVTATDISTNALKMAIHNAQKLGATITFKEQSLLTGDKEGYDVVLANLPYVPTSMQDPSIGKEPKLALFSGSDGLDHYRTLFEQLEPKYIRFVLTESLVTQHKSVTDLATHAGYELTKTDGLVQLFMKTA